MIMMFDRKCLLVNLELCCSFSFFQSFLLPRVEEEQRFLNKDFYGKIKKEGKNFTLRREIKFLNLF